MRIFRNRLASGGMAVAASMLVAHSVQAQETGAEYAESLGIPVELVDAACADGGITVYSLILADEDMHPATEFGKHFPCIDVEIYAASGGAIGQRFMSEFRAGTAEADLIMNSSPAFGKRMIEGDMLLDYTPPGAKNIPDSWKEEGKWYAMGLVYIGIGYNTNEISEGDQAWIDSVETWEDVFDNPFTDRMAMVDVRAGGSTHLPYYYFKTELGLESWEKLAEGNPTIFNGINPLADQLAAGAFAFVPHATLDTAVNKRRKLGAPIQWKFPEPGLGLPYFMGIASNAPHADAAKLFMAWSMTGEGQTTWVNRTGLAPASKVAEDNRDVSQQPWYALPETIYDADWTAIEDDLPNMIEEFDQIMSK